MNYAKVTFFLVLISVTGASLFAQPYYYYAKSLDVKGNSDIYRVNLATGQNLLFFSDAGRVQSVSWNQDQTWLYVSTKYDFELIQTDSRQKHVLVATDDYQGLDGAVFVPQLAKLFVTWSKRDGDTGGMISQTYVFDPASFSLVDSNGVPVDASSILSEDGTRYYDYGPDSSGNYTVSCISLRTKNLIDEKPFHAVGPRTELKRLLGGRRGKALIEYELRSGFANQRYCLVDLRTNTVQTDFPFPWRSEAQLTPDGKHILVEEVQFINDNNPNTPAEYSPGIVYIYDAESGRLLQRLSLPPEGRVLVFDNYPDKLFYYNQLRMQSISVDVTVVTPDIILLDTLVSLKHQAKSKSWLADKNFVDELDNHLDNAQKHLAKDDSVNARKEIEKFQEKVDKEYQKTADDHKKGKARDKRFVTEDGWKLLYFNAQYIIDRLPEKSRGGRDDEKGEKHKK
jgi:WD40 repeat protein